MKIVIFSAGFQDLMIQLASALAEREEVVLMLPKDVVTERHLELLSDKVIFEPFSQPKNRSPKNILTMIRVVSRIRKHDPDVLHLQASGSLWFFLAFPFLKKYPIVNTIHDPKPHMGEERAKYGFMMKNGLKYSDRFIVHGHKLKEDMMKYYGVEDGLIHVVSHGDLSIMKRWTDQKFEEVPNTILYFGRIWKYKGLDYLIKAEPLISERTKDFRIVIAGRGEDFSRYEEMMVNRDRFIVKNYRISNEEVNQLFQEASIVVLPYLEATQSGVVPLAYTFGKPVVVTDVGAIPEVVDDGKTGFIVPPSDPAALAGAIVPLLEDPGLRAKMGQAAYEKGQEVLAWDTIAEDTLGVYRESINKNMK